MKKIALVILSLFALQSLSAQTISELYKFSNYDFSASTARSAAMAGAFTSLGADLSSMSINPAGLAMYSSNEAAFTMGVNSANTTTNYSGKNYNTNNNTVFTLPNISGAYKVNDDFVIAFGYNTLANFNSSMTAVGNYEQFNSRARIWADQLNGIPSAELDNERTLFNGRPSMLRNALMAYDSYLVDPLSDGSDKYGVWGLIDPMDMIASQMRTTTEGSLNEVALSAGYNWDDVIYVGMTLGFQYLNYGETSTYSEFNLLDDETKGIFRDFHLYDRTYIQGTGFDMKIGITARPTPWLRIGAAFHSPSWMTITEFNNGELDPYFDGRNGRYTASPDYIQDYNMQSPSRLLLGASATLFGAMIVSFDYELTWYNSMMYNTDMIFNRMREMTLSSDIDNLPNYIDNTSARGYLDFNGMIKDYYKPTNNFRVGIEAQPVRSLFLRVGAAYSDSPYQNVESYYEPGTLMSKYGSTLRYTAGIGYRTGRFNIDAAYTRTEYNSQPAKFFDYYTVNAYDTHYMVNGHKEIIPANTNIASLENIYQEHHNDNFILTLSFRF